MNKPSICETRLGKKAVMAWLPPELHEEFRRHCHGQFTSISVKLRELVVQELRKKS